MKIKRPPKSIVLVLGVIVSLAITGQLFDIPFTELKSTFSPFQNHLNWKTALIGGLVYAVLLSIPFFPGIELAWLTIFLFGKDAIILIYLCTLLGLSTSFMVGRKLSFMCPTCQEKLKKIEGLYLEKFNGVAERIHGVISKRTCNLWFNELLRKSHYFALAVLINIPGNAAIGGGGGIALLSGMNRTFSWKGFFITSCIAISPVPFLLYFGFLQIESFVG